MKGMAGGEALDVCARLGSVAATYALEHLGGQSHCVHPDGVSGSPRGALRSDRRSELRKFALNLSPVPRSCDRLSPDFVR